MLKHILKIFNVVKCVGRDTESWTISLRMPQWAYDFTRRQEPWDAVEGAGFVEDFVRGNEDFHSQSQIGVGWSVRGGINQVIAQGDQINGHAQVGLDTIAHQFSVWIGLRQT